MAIHRTITRYFLIISLVKQPGFPGFSRIREMLDDHGFSLSDRTIQRDIRYIREEFGIEIEYDDQNNGYYIDIENSLEMGSLLKFLEMAVLTGNFTDIFSNTEKAENIISFDGEGLVKGVEFISPLIFAISKNRRVRLTYKRFTDSTPFPVLVKPALLKEYQNRWYLVGLVNKGNDIRSYALDRTIKVELDEDVFNKEETKGVRENYANLIGLSHSGGKPVLVELEIETNQARYIETLPWHCTQEVVSRSDRSVIFSLFVVPNFELQQKILSLGKAVLNIKPASLKETINENK